MVQRKQREVSLSLDKALLEEIDERRGDIPRSKFVQRILEKSVK